MDAALLISALALGLGAGPHCALMCGAPCAAAGLRGRALAGFLLARTASYAAAGAAVAWAVSSLGQWATTTAVLRPAWVALHAAVMALGLWMLIRARLPVWLQRRPDAAGSSGGQPMQWALAGPSRGPSLVTSRQPPSRWTAWTGLGWALWPCGMLQSALLLALLASGPLGGAGVMAGFALASAPGLALAPFLLGQVRRRWGDGVQGDRILARAAGAGLAVAALWALLGPAGQTVLCLS